jgi:hypothetical protein
MHEQVSFSRGQVGDEKISEESSILGNSSNGSVQEEIKNEGA